MGFLRDSDNKHKPVVAKLRLNNSEPDLSLAELLRQPDLKIRGVRVPLGLHHAVQEMLKAKWCDEGDVRKYLYQCIDDYLLVERYHNALETYKAYWPTTKPSDEEEG